MEEEGRGRALARSETPGGQEAGEEETIVGDTEECDADEDGWEEAGGGKIVIGEPQTGHGERCRWRQNGAEAGLARDRREVEVQRPGVRDKEHMPRRVS